jgi:hypothetical protein
LKWFNWFKRSKDPIVEVERVNPRMYLILREDLTYKYIQGGHAIAQFALEHPIEFKEWDNKYLICVSVFNGMVLRQLLAELSLKNLGDSLASTNLFEKSAFYEPDLESTLPTAIAIFENGDGWVTEELKHLKLATK